jgi:hypothetical protein
MPVFAKVFVALTILNTFLLLYLSDVIYHIIHSPIGSLIQ